MAETHTKIIRQAGWNWFKNELCQPPFVFSAFLPVLSQFKAIQVASGIEPLEIKNF